MKKMYCLVMATIMIQAAYAQAKLSGRVTDNSGEPLAGVSIIIAETRNGTISDAYGNFIVSINNSLPVTLIFSSIGFDSLRVVATDNHFMNVSLATKYFQQDLTLAATRAPIKLISAPVTIEKLGQRDIQTTPAASPYDAIANLKGVDFVTSSLTFKTPSTRGFNGSGSTRVNQWVDGMDNQAPGMNFSVGNFAGLMDLDIESIDLLPGASSALFGPGGLNGTILINSKNPFKYQGLSVNIKEGAMNIDKSQRTTITGYHDWSIRYAKALGKRFAFKIGAQYFRATDWLANDSTNYLRAQSKTIPGTRSTDPNYDGVNVYGDESTLNIQPFIPATYQAFFPSVINVSRTGYDEKSLIDPETKNIKISAAVHYKIGTETEAIVAGNFGTGNTVYTGSDRYTLKNIKIGQYKAELRNANWFLRAYTTQENAGDSYATTTITRYLNEAWKPSDVWYGQYLNTFVPAVLTGANIATAHSLARAEADKGRPLPGSPQFMQLFNKLAAIPISQGGGLFLDRSNLYMAEGQYNLSKQISFADILIGGNYKKYVLNSQGTIFIDTAGTIGVNEYGGYIQATKKLFKNHLTLAASGRIDKNENFREKITPRFSAVLKVATNHNIRVSYQTAYKFPSTQQQFIKLQIASDVFLLGGLPWIKDYTQANKEPVYQVAGNTLQPYNYNELKPESSKSVEVGYKGLIANKLMVDAYTYFSSFTDFLGRITLFRPSNSTYYSVVSNSSTIVKSFGMGVGMQYYFTKNIAATFNSYYDKITNVPNGFVANYNTPRYRVNTGISGTNLGTNKKLGFGVQFKWQDKFLFENDFATGYVEAWTTLDAQVNYKLVKNTCEIRLGGTNLLNNYYKNGFGSPEIGGLYYMGLRFDIQ